MGVRMKSPSSVLGVARYVWEEECLSLLLVGSLERVCVKSQTPSESDNTIHPELARVSSVLPWH